MQTARHRAYDDSQSCNPSVTTKSDTSALKKSFLLGYFPSDHSIESVTKGGTKLQRHQKPHMSLDGDHISEHDNLLPKQTGSGSEATTTGETNVPVNTAAKTFEHSGLAAPNTGSAGSASKNKTSGIQRAGPQRMSRVTHKLKLLPEADNINDETNSTLKLENGHNGKEVYSQVNQIKDKPARRDAEKLGKKQRHLLPRVTAYCTCGSYKMKELIRWIKDCRKAHHTHPKLFDECLYTPFIYNDWRGDKRFEHDDIIRLDDEGGEINVSSKQPDLFIYEYGVIVMWGFTEREEKAFLSDLDKFEMEKLAPEDVQVEQLNYYITQSYQPRIYNDFITLKDGSNYLIKLSISHAIAQSVKISLFEELVDNTIEDTQNIPQQIASMGKISMTKEEIMKSIGELFILRININLHGSVMDSPEIMWAEPQLEPIYQATRGYLEINQRVGLLNQRLEVISDLLQMLKEQLGQSDEEYLEFIVIVLVGVEVLVSVVNIIVDIIADL